MITSNGDVLCAEDVTYDDIESDYVNEPNRALTFDIDLAAEGFTLFEDPTADTWKQGTYESGFHHGQNDSPPDILARAHSQGWDQGIFKIPSVGQFDLEFQLWVRRLEDLDT